MYRLLLAGLILVPLAGCAKGITVPSFGLTDTEDAPSIISSVRSSRSRGGDTAAGIAAQAQRQRQAALNKDAAPAGSFARAPSGALAGSDFVGVKLDIDQARKLVNDYRRSKGLRPLSIDSQLTSAAKAHSRDLARWDRISHYGSDGSNPWDRVKRSGYNAKLAAENVGTGQATIEDVFKGWQKSPGHNKNLLLGDADHMGIALVHDPKTEFKTFWTLVIGARL